MLKETEECNNLPALSFRQIQEADLWGLQWAWRLKGAAGLCYLEHKGMEPINK